MTLSLNQSVTVSFYSVSDKTTILRSVKGVITEFKANDRFMAVLVVGSNNCKYWLNADLNLGMYRRSEFFKIS